MTEEKKGLLSHLGGWIVSGIRFTAALAFLLCGLGGGAIAVVIGLEGKPYWAGGWRGEPGAAGG